MSERFQQLCHWTEQGIAGCEELQQVLSRERVSLIALRGDELMEIIMSKEMMVSRLFALRKQIREGIKRWYGAETVADLERGLSEAERLRWRDLQGRWKTTWEKTRDEVERNQSFLKHSQRNLGRLIEHWRGLLGESPLYSAKGQKVDADSTGKVFEAKF